MDWFHQALSEVQAQAMTWTDTVSPARLLACLSIIALFWLFRRGYGSLTITILRAACRRLGINISDSVETSIRPAAELFVVGLGLLIGLKVLDLQASLAFYPEKVVQSVLVAAVFSGLYATCDLLADLVYSQPAYRSKPRNIWINRTAKVITAFVGIAAVLKVWGVDIGPLLTGMGVAGAAVALAAQDILKNLLAGITNVSERRFGVGDWILAEGVTEGTVEDMDFRSTQVRRFDKALVHVSNAELANTPLVNFSRMTHRRIYWKINITYATTTGQLSAICKAIDAYLADNEDFVQPPDALRLVRVDALGDSAVGILVYCFTHATGYERFTAVQERLALEIKTIVSKSGGAFAFPSRSIYIEAAPEAGPDGFVPSKKADS